MAGVTKKVLRSFDDLAALSADPFFAVHICLHTVFFADGLNGFSSAHCFDLSICGGDIQ